MPVWIPVLTGCLGLIGGLLLARRDPDRVITTLRDSVADAHRAVLDSAKAYAQHTQECGPRIHELQLALNRASRRADASRDAYADHLRRCPLTSADHDAQGDP